MTRLEIIGGGRMGSALLSGLVTAGWADPHELRVVEPVAARREVGEDPTRHPRGGPVGMAEPAG